jgi:Uma2 family endonuclease
VNEPRHRHHSYTYEEYVAIEVSSDIKHEFLDGDIYAMSGGSDEHAALAGEVIGILRIAARKRRCRVYTPDLRVRVESVPLTTYPDAAVICGPVQRFEEGPETTVLNPMILVEVTSPSSERYDTGEKFEYYRTIPSLRDYVIVSHRERRITVHSRHENGTWSAQVAIKGGRVALPSLDAELEVDEVYRESTISAD